MADTLFDEIAGCVVGAIDASGWADGTLSKQVIDKLVECTRNRPHPWSTASDYTSWKSLTDRTYQARHLPAAAPGVQPKPEDVQKLFARPDGTQTLSQKSTCLFPAFAQYLTDGFIRTDPHHRDRTTSNHEIDLCPLYGRTEAQTLILRENNNTQGRRGRLKSQVVDGEEYPPFLYTRDGSAIEPAFVGLDSPLLGPPGAPTPPPEQLVSLFAIGGDRANATPFTAMMNTLFLREHNRVAGQLDDQNPTWDDERVFQTARNIMIPIFIKIVVEQYINHISPTPFNLIADPSVAWTANWNRPNWITAEFSLLYRWHSLMPDAIDWSSGHIPLGNFGLDNRPLIGVGLAAAFSAAARQAAAELGALNTNAAILGLETLAVLQARFNHLASYNAYRVQFGLNAAQSFSDIASDPRVAAVLQELYPTPDDVEFYPGLFAEESKSPLPGLLLRMVGVDAFSHALTNPLLSEHVFNETTFTSLGFQLIQDTKSLGDILVRQGAAVNPKTITMIQPSWSY
jgi:Animal haem peroxidase